MSWQDRDSVRKGNIGEKIVDDWLLARGWVPYRPIADAAHPFDRLVASRDKKQIVVVEVKSKPAREAFPDTGIDFRHFCDYRGVATKYRIPVFLAFVDEKASQVYGQFLSKLLQTHREYGREYPWRPRPNKKPDIVYFALSQMRHIANLSSEQVLSLAELRKSGFRETAA